MLVFIYLAFGLLIALDVDFMVDVLYEKNIALSIVLNIIPTLIAMFLYIVI